VAPLSFKKHVTGLDILGQVAVALLVAREDNRLEESSKSLQKTENRQREGRQREQYLPREHR
jgi:hypothetical protein